MGRRDNKRRSRHDDTNLGTRVAYRHHGRLFEADVLRSGSTTITRDGIWLCNADWNGRALDTGLQELHSDLDTSIEIQNALSAAIAASEYEKRSRRG